MNKSDVLVIGAGATGLMAAYKLSKSGKTVAVLEARNHTGGRIHTLNNELFFQHAELGAEFIHGNLPITLELLKQAGIPYHHAGGEMWQYHEGKFNKNGFFIEGWDELLEKLQELKEDLSIHEFLEKEFPGDKYARLRDSTKQYVAGYDTANPKLASALALRTEWLNEDEDAQHRIEGGYCALIKFLADEIKGTGSLIVLNAVAKQVLWKPNDVKIITADDTIYEAAQVVIAMPLGVLQADKENTASLTIHPAINGHHDALQNIGFGAIIKVLLEFDKAFWEDDETEKLVGASLKNMGFLFTDEAIPTWWTQAPQHTPLLTGWLGGPKSFEKKDMQAEDILQLGLTSLSHVFKIPADVLKRSLIAWHVANWTAELFTLGSYAYDKVGSADARKVLLQPVDNTLFFAGEYLYDGPAMGTVEAALTSGKNVAEDILKS